MGDKVKDILRKQMKKKKTRKLENEYRKQNMQLVQLLEKDNREMVWKKFPRIHKKCLELKVMNLQKQGPTK